MNKHIYNLFFVLIAVSAFFFSCNDDDKYSSDPNHRLSFSSDTIHFDTVFTTIGSATYTMKIYNRNNEHLNISSVYLANPAQSGFRVNVDGHSGEQFTDLEIRKKDSMYVFVEVNVDPTQKDNPILIKDSLVFQLSNGVKQDVKLLAYGQDILILRGKVIEQDTVFTSYRPILVYDSLRVDEGATLTLSKGTRLYFHDKIYCDVYGSLKAEGTLDEPVLFRGDRLDWMFSDRPYDVIAGQWGGLRFFETSYENHLDFVKINSGYDGIRCDSSDVERLKLTLENSIVHNMKRDCINITSSKVRVGNSQITNAGINCISVLGGDVEFIHCTIADFYYPLDNSSSARSGVSIALKEGENKPLLNADFRNCIVTGSFRDELSLSKLEESENPFNYSFSYSLINTKLNEDDDDYEEQLSHYTEVVWDDKKEKINNINVDLSKDKNFRKISHSSPVEYDFRLDSVSAAVGIASMTDAIKYPFDLQGRSRISDGKPDAGCFEWREGDGKEGDDI